MIRQIIDRILSRLFRRCFCCNRIIHLFMNSYLNGTVTDGKRDYLCHTCDSARRVTINCNLCNRYVIEPVFDDQLVKSKDSCCKAPVGFYCFECAYRLRNLGFRDNQNAWDCVYIKMGQEAVERLKITKCSCSSGVCRECLSTGVILSRYSPLEMLAMQAGDL